MNINMTSLDLNRAISLYMMDTDKFNDRTSAPVYQQGWELGDLINVGDPSTPFGPW